MILADKIIRLRKKNGWSQEELAEKMNVSRQAVSKWEGAQTIPDLEKILLLGELFGVTTDYLLKDDIEGEEFTDSNTDFEVKRVSLAEANEYLKQRERASIHIAAATFLCILSPISLILLAIASESSFIALSEDMAVIIGLIVLFVLVTIAIVIFVLCGFRNAPYEFLEKEEYETEYGVKGMVHEKQKAYRSTYIRTNIIAICLCVLSPIPLLVGAFTYNDILVGAMLAVTMILAGIGTMLFIIVGVRWASMQKMLKEGEYADAVKKKYRIKNAIETVYWLVVTALYLGWSFMTNDWQITWIVWPVAAILSVIIAVICNIFIDKEKG